ncbi:relaxin-3-like [Pristis pectinata]|uniref:relaxin-3-like n=1 Tax=Pristis pectinata TaxID=685728 RepID=UPI00223D07B9|nr:relaxin-3-like [Pristis pectinata]
MQDIFSPSTYVIGGNVHHASACTPSPLRMFRSCSETSSTLALRRHQDMQKLWFTLAVWLLIPDSQLEVEARNPSLGVKLCGREFIRAVIFTCGGSRWKRTEISLPDIADPFSHLPQTMDDANTDSWDLADDVTNYKPATWRFLVGFGDEGRSRRSISNDVLEALRSTDRKGRDVVVALSNACCKWGCTKSEISSLC